MQIPFDFRTWWNSPHPWLKSLIEPQALFTLLAFLAAGIAVYQTSINDASNRFNELRTYLVELSYVGREATSPEASQICSPESGCLGSLTIKQSYFDQYELLAMNVYQMAEELDELETETMAIADALYKCGRLDKSVAYAERLMDSEDHGLRFRSHLLLAQIYYFKGEPENGARQIDLALEIISDPRNKIPKVEQGIMRAQAHLTHGRMLVAMGMPEQSVAQQEAAFGALKDLPETNRVTQLTDTLESLVYASKEKNQLQGKTFQKFIDDLEPTLAEGAPAPESAPAAPEAPAQFRLSVDPNSATTPNPNLPPTSSILE